MKVHVKKKAYGNNVIIRDVDFEMLKGTTTLVIGTSGAGKSTLINCIIKGSKEYVDFDKESPRIAYIQQHPALNMNLTVHDTIYYARKFEHLTESRESIEKNVDEYVKMLGLSRRVNNKVRNLSGGQQQRVAIAKELIRDTDILIADEIDTGLDCGVAYSLASELSKITKKKDIITLVISHNVVNIELYDNVLVLAKDSEGIGGVAYFGSSDDIETYFEVEKTWEILREINMEDEGGNGRADEFIKKNRDPKTSTKHRGDANNE